MWRRRTGNTRGAKALACAGTTPTLPTFQTTDLIAAIAYSDGSAIFPVTKMFFANRGLITVNAGQLNVCYAKGVKRKKSPKRVVVLLGVLLAAWPSAGLHADEVYRWVDNDGVAHYSTKPGSSGAKPAALPKINRGEVILSKSRVQSCEGHGGVNCEAGPDLDGSVICHDQFKDAPLRFRSSCSAAKLEVAGISDLDDGGGFAVLVRNRKPVAAQSVRVSFKGANGRTVALSGPEVIDPFGSAEYSFVSSLSIQGVSIGEGGIAAGKPKPFDVDIECLNCP